MLENIAKVGFIQSCAFFLFIKCFEYIIRHRQVTDSKSLLATTREQMTVAVPRINTNLPMASI